MNRYFLFIFSFVLAQGALFASAEQEVSFDEVLDWARTVNPDAVVQAELRFKGVELQNEICRILQAWDKTQTVKEESKSE
ncbi:hypothetical protein EBR77_00400 [bacterium]|nr:hypothetical protein [bacterium]NBX78355.1 hypothetical protein [bacterium]